MFMLQTLTKKEPNTGSDEMFALDFTYIEDKKKYKNYMSTLSMNSESSDYKDFPILYKITTPSFFLGTIYKDMHFLDMYNYKTSSLRNYHKKLHL